MWFNRFIRSFGAMAVFTRKAVVRMQYTAPILGKVSSHASLVLVWIGGRKIRLPNLSRFQEQIKNIAHKPTKVLMGRHLINVV
ncbi:hypothetical protein C6Y12_05025 [Lactiplantibacillus pentosus]|uniref:hypothetical protein n=2 Tax=Lactiplantibacillus pentosus TaxID=1589 RepID=UPI000D0165CA|nr:hypothetical protein [Lactiplantibacillus pentosus]MCT3301793.1 hypothetical protein [Lactiplantibacillus pentosus]PRO81344.1 hypothetical protein C6Y09_06695 [Lactiplantibacillus pentosus]PRO92585.1 hypothetical protein C6Y12_05025 [Lactiplantibacillus pentosus]